MARRLVLACLALAAAAPPAGANGRSPATSSITFRQGHESDIAVGLTFGLLISRDSGATWQWICENAVGYGGMYDPYYVFSPSGALFASTFDGLKVMRDGCTFETTSSGSGFVAAAVLDADHTLYVAAAEPPDPGNGIAGDYKVYRSTDDGATFPMSSLPVTNVSWWQSLAVAPSDTRRVYLTGYRFVPDPSGGSRTEQLLLRSDDGGTGWIELPITAFTLMPNSRINIVGIAKDNPDRLYARVDAEDNQVTASIYRSVDRGATWERILHKAVPIPAFLVRDNGDLIAGTQTLGAEISHDDGASWVALVDPPHMNCLVENSAHEVWACTQNYGRPTVPSDEAGIMKTTDLVTWTKVLRYQDLTDAVGCAPGTIQRDDCAALWCAVCDQLGCTPSPSYRCGAVEAPPPSKGGCCDGGAGAGGGLALGLVVGTLMVRPRRRSPMRQPRRKGT